MVSCSGKYTKPDNALQQSYLVGQGWKVNFFHTGREKIFGFSYAPPLPRGFQHNPVPAMIF